MYLPENKFQYNFILYQVGYEKCKPEHHFGPLIRDFYVLHYIINGTGYIKVNGRISRMTKGDMFIVPVNRVCEYYADPGDPYEYYWVGFHGVNVEDIVKHIGFVDENYVIHPERQEDIARIMSDMCDFSPGKHNNFTLLGGFYTLLGVLTGDGLDFNAEGTSADIVKKLAQYVEINYANDITVETMSRFVNLHRSNVYRMFKAIYNVSPQEYILNFRMDKALFLLKNTTMSIKEIAYATGFSDASYFCKIFKKRHQKTPQEARKLL